MLCEEVAVDDLDQAVQLLNGQQAHGNVEDEISKHFAESEKEKRLGGKQLNGPTCRETVRRCKVIQRSFNATRMLANALYTTWDRILSQK